MEHGDGALLCLVQAMDIPGITDEQLLDIIKSNNCYENFHLIEHCFEDALLEFVVGLLEDELNLTQQEVAYLTAHSEVAFEMLAFLNSHNHDANSILAANNMVNIISQGWLSGPYPESQRDAIIAQYNFPTPEDYYQYATWCAILVNQWAEAHPGQQPNNAQMTLIALEAYWKTISDEIHTLLDICGLIPAAGEPCDGVNGVIYLMEGDGVNATFSFAATFPILGWASTGAKWVRIAVNTAAGVKHLKITKVGSLFEFSHYTSFRSMMGITDPNKQAHHLISWSKKNNEVVQRAAEAGYPSFHMNNPNTNGLPIDTWRNQPNHNQYDEKIETALQGIKNQLQNSFGTSLNNIPPGEVSTVLQSFQDYLIGQINAFPNSHLNDIPISYP